MKDTQFGATGRFPEGKLNADDEGEIKLGVVADRKNKVVVVEFGTPVTWLGIPPETARQLAALLIKSADSLK